VFFAPVINGNYSGWDTLRYNVGYFYLGILNLGFIVYLVTQNQKFQSRYFSMLQLLVIVLMVLALFAGITRYSHRGVQAFFNYYPKEVQALDKLAQAHGLKMGVGNYWVAKHSTMFSKNGVIIHPVFDHLQPFYHTMNENMFYDDGAIYNFIVLNRFVDTSTYKRYIGEGILLDAGANLKIIKVDPFKFDRKSKQPYLVGKRPK